MNTKDNINESVLDPVQNQRCDALFNPNDKSEQPILLQSTKDFIIGILEKFKADTKIKGLEITQAFIVGSSLGYQYKDTSDIDVDIQVNIPKEKMKGKFSMIPKNIMLPNTSHPVNIFIMFADEDEYDFNHCENAYDLLSDSWIKQGRLENADAIPFQYLAGVSEFIMDGMALELHRAERDLYDLDKYVKMDPNKVAISEDELKTAISEKISTLIIDKDALRLAHTMMFRLGNGAYEGHPISISIKYQYEDKHFAMDSLIYKYVDGYGYYEKIDEMVKTIDAAVKNAKNRLKEVTEASPKNLNDIEAANEINDKVGELAAAYNDAAAQQAQEEVEPEPSDLQQATGEVEQQPTEQSEQEYSDEPAEEQALTESVKTNATFEEKMKFLADDEQEAIDGYADIIEKIDDENVKKQLTKIMVEEKAHKAFLEKVISNKSLEYTEPLDEENYNENKLTEQYSDEELQYILRENGFEDSLLNVYTLRLNSDWCIVDKYDETQLTEDLRSRTEKYVNKKIFKASGKVNRLIGDGFGFLFAGPIGLIVADKLIGDHNAELDDEHRELADAVMNDPDASECIEKIREELRKDIPNKARIRLLKKQFAQYVKAVKADIDNNREAYNKAPKIHL